MSLTSGKGRVAPDRLEGILTNPGSRSALTQPVGRILRQPYARKTHVPALDESYVFCFQRQGSKLLQEVRKGFGLERLHGMEGRIVADAEEAAEETRAVTLRQREEFQSATRDLVLPAFMIRDPGGWRLVRYESDILSRVAWDEVDLNPLFDLPLGEGGMDYEVRAGLESEALSAAPETHGGSPGAASDKIDYCFAASHLLDAMPNPWRGSEAARQVFGTLLRKHPPQRVASNYVFILEELRKRLEAERDRLSQIVFRKLLADETMKFIVVADHLTSNRLSREIKTVPGKQANREDGSPFQRNLFDQIHEDDLNGLENKVATYLDQQERLFFWFRNRARKDYYAQGWSRDNIDRWYRSRELQVGYDNNVGIAAVPRRAAPRGGSEPAIEDSAPNESGWEWRRRWCYHSCGVRRSLRADCWTR